MSTNINQPHTHYTPATQTAVITLQNYLLPSLLGLIWLFVLSGIIAQLPLHFASWLTFIGLLIAPGYFLADIITWRLNLDWFQRLAIALPVGFIVIAIPGITALLLHMTLPELVSGWIATSAIVLTTWFITIWRRPAAINSEERPSPLTADEWLLIIFILVAFILSLPTIARYKIDGDAFAVSSFTADALANLPLNATEPLFGTNLGPGVRAVFNQSLPMTYLWASLSGIDPITLVATAARPVIALWVLLAAYTLGAAAFNSRRFGLYAAAIQILIYLAAPFWRGDNVSLFFFERTDADKFLVTATMLPIVFAFALRYVRFRRYEDWFAAAIAAIAVSLIHPLIAAMLALGLTSFGIFHFLFNLHDSTTYRRVVALAGLAILTMLIPVVQLILSRGEAPLASAYPDSFEGWTVGERMTPVLPFLQIPSLHYYGNQPDLDHLKAADANSNTSPFLIWRFAVNAERQRLIFFDIDSYVSDPRLIFEPIYLLALLMLPFLLVHIHRSLAAQFIVGVTAGILFILFNPFLMPLIGSLVFPWILWRLVWLFPYALIIAAASHRLLHWLITAVHILITKIRQRRPSHLSPAVHHYALISLLFIVTLILSPRIRQNLHNLDNSTAFFFPTPTQLLHRLNELTTADPGLVLADQNLSVPIPAYAAHAHVLAHRVPNTSEIFPATAQDVALQRLIDQHAFFNTPLLTTNSINILQHYNIAYIVVESGSELDRQLRLATDWFEWQLDDQSYSLYTVHQTPRHTATIQGNTAFSQGLWSTAVQFYLNALAADPTDRLAQMGLIEATLAQGQFDSALTQLEELVAQNNWPVLHYRLGQLYAEMGDIERSQAQFDAAQQAAPAVSRYHIALGNICLMTQQLGCTTTQYALAVANNSFPDEAARHLAEADLWRQPGQMAQALPLYEQAVALNPSLFNQFVLQNVYQELGQYQRAENVVNQLRADNPLRPEALSAQAGAMVAQNRIDEAIDLYQKAIQLQRLLVQDPTDNRLALSQLYLQTNQLDKAQRELESLLIQQPYQAIAYRLQGDLYHRQGEMDQALVAYQRAFTLDPGQIANVVALTQQMQQNGRSPTDLPPILQTAIAANPREATLYLTLGDHRQRQGDAQAALNAYHDALTRLDTDQLERPLQGQAINENRAVIYARLARLAEDQGQAPTALHYYQAAVATAPHLGWTHVLLGDAYRRRNNFEAAYAAYAQAINHDPTYANAYVQQAELLIAHGQVEEGTATYNQALAVLQGLPHTSDISDLEQFTSVEEGVYEEAPAFSDSIEVGGSSIATNNTIIPLFNSPDDQINTISIFARLLQVNQQVSEAIELYQSRIDAGQETNLAPPILAQYYKGMGDLYLSELDYAEAITAYQAAIAHDGWWPEAYLGLAEAQTSEGDALSALQSLKTAVALAPGSAAAQIALATNLELRGESEQALAIYQATLADHPGDAQTSLALARAWQARNHDEEAYTYFQRAISQSPNTVDAYVGLAELALAQKQWDESQSYLDQALAIDQQNFNTIFRYAELEQQRGNNEAARDWYQRAAEVPLTDNQLNITVIDALLQYGEAARALQFIEDGLTRRPNYSELLLRQAQAQARLGQFAEAESSYLQVLELDEDNDRFLAGLAAFYLDRGRTDEAFNLYQQAVTFAPDESAYYLAISRILQAKGEFNDAAALLNNGLPQVLEPAPLYRALLDLHLQRGRPDLAEQSVSQGLINHDRLALQLVLGLYYESQADFAEAEALYNALQATWPNEADVAVALADLHLGQNDLDGAINYYQQAIALEPSEPSYYLSLGNAYVLADQLDEAESIYQRALILAPALENAYINLGTLYQEQGRWDEARATYWQGLTILPVSPLLMIQYGRYWQLQDDGVTALAWLDQAVLTSPTAAMMIARAPVYTALGYDEAAEQDLLTAVQSEPGSIIPLIALADWYRDQGDTTQAEQYYLQAVTLMPGVPTSYLRLGNLANDQGDRTAAEEYEAQAEAAAPGAFVR